MLSEVQSMVAPTRALQFSARADHLYLGAFARGLG